MFSAIFSTCFLLFAALFVTIGILRARKRHWSVSLAKAILTVLSAVLAFVLTSLLVPVISGALVEPVKAILNATPIADIFTQIPSAKDAMLMLTYTLVAPVFFLLVFTIFKTVLPLALYRPVAKLCLIIAGAIAKKDAHHFDNVDLKEKQEKACPASMVIGAVCSLLAYIVFLIPVTSTVSTAATLGKTISNEGIVYEVCDSLTDNVGSDVVGFVGTPVWRATTSFNINGEKVSAATETYFIANFVSGVVEISSSDIDTVRGSAATFRGISAYCEKTSLVPRFCSEFINAANDEWLNGGEFIGISMPSLSTSGDSDIIRTLLECLDNSTPETMKEDLAALLNVMAIIAEHAEFDKSGVIDMASILEDTDVISAFSVELLASPRLAPAMNSFVMDHIKSANAYIDLPDKNSKDYTNLVDGLFNTYKNEVTDSTDEESLNRLAVALGATLAENGVQVKEHEQLALAATFIGEFGSGEDLTPAQVSDFIEDFRAQ